MKCRPKMLCHDSPKMLCHDSKVREFEAYQFEKDGKMPDWFHNLILSNRIKCDYILSAFFLRKDNSLTLIAPNDFIVNYGSDDVESYKPIDFYRLFEFVK